MNNFNRQLILVCGESGTGKTASLENLRNSEKWVYLNCESGKPLTIQTKFNEMHIEDPYDVYDAFDACMEHIDECEGIIIDSLTFLMDMYEEKYVKGVADTRKAWGEFGSFFKNLMQDKIVKFPKPVIVIAHVLEQKDEATGEYHISIPIKGSVKNFGVESYFSTTVLAKTCRLKELESYKNDLLHITEDDEIVQMKYVFQTRKTKDTTNTRVRSPKNMFTQQETYMDNDCQLLLDRLDSFYGE